MAGVRTAKELFVKTPEEVLFKHFEFAGDDLVDDEVIDTVDSLTVEPTGEVDDLVADDAAADGTRVQIELSLGREGVTYSVHITVTTNKGQTLEGCGKIKVGPC